MAIKKGIILAGGLGTRLLPITRVINKHMIPIINKPMVLYPLNTLKEMGVEDVLIVTGGNHVGQFADFLGDGSEYGVNLTYKVQKEAGGIAQALSLAEDFVDGQFAAILGDNIFEYAPEVPLASGLVLREVSDPQRFGVYYEGQIEEKPAKPKSNKVVTGLYFYTPEIFEFIKTLRPSERGELEISDVNNWCLKNRTTELIYYDGFWTDAGTPESLIRAVQWAKWKTP